MAASEAGTRFAKIAGAVGLPLTEIGKLGNATNALADSFKTDANEVTDTATRSANVLSQQFGLSEDAVLALSASMNEASPSSRKAAGSLRRAAEALMDPNKVENTPAPSASRRVSSAGFARRTPSSCCGWSPMR